jgi:hypothetical protein
MKRKKNAFRMILLCMFVIIGLSGCQEKKVAETKETEKPKETNKIKLSPGITAEAVSARAWEVYDGRQPEIKDSIPWQCDIGQLVANTYNSGSQILISGQQQISSGNKSFTIKIEAYSTYEKGVAIKPQGRFLEIQLLLTNAGKTAESFCLQNDAASGMQARLTLPDKKIISPRGFLFPKLGLYDLSWAASLSGKIWVQLESQQKTWVLLLFDVPAESKEVELQVLNAKPLKITIPEWQQIEPSARYYSGEIVKAPQTVNNKSGNTFGSGTFSFWLSANRSAVEKFSVTLKNTHWNHNGKAGEVPEITLSFSDFSRPMLNHYIHVPIPACYDIEGAFTSPTAASGTINLHHFDANVGKGKIDFGTWQWKAIAMPEEKRLENKKPTNPMP